MSQLTDIGENKTTDWLLRAQAFALGASLHAALASAAADGSITEITGTGYVRQAMSRALATWAGTQGAGTTAASSGTTHTTSNNAAVNFGTAGSAWGSVSHVVFYDASTSGNPLFFIPLPNGAISVANGDPVSFAIGTLGFSFGLAGGCSDYLANKWIDYVCRGQAFTPPATTYEALFTTAPVNSGGGVEVAGGSYARVAITSGLAAWAGTQGAGTTVASTGSSGKTSNNAPITFPAPTGTWGAIAATAEYDAPTAGNLLFYAPLNTPRTVASGSSAPVFNAAGRTITFQ